MQNIMATTNDILIHATGSMSITGICGIIIAGVLITGLGGGINSINNGSTPATQIKIKIKKLGQFLKIQLRTTSHV